MNKPSYFYIIENAGSLSSEDLKFGPRIFQFSAPVSIDDKIADGPFIDLNTLKRESVIWKRISQKDTKRAQQILNLNKMNRMVDQIYVPAGKTYSKDFILMITHILQGKIIRGEGKGVHWYNEDRVRITKLIDMTTKGVFYATIELYDKKSRRWFPKKTASHFFPTSWSRNQLFLECYYATENKKKVRGSETIYKSTTLSGIDVEIVVKKRELKSIYPVIK